MGHFGWFVTFRILLLLQALFPLHVGSPVRIAILHLLLSSASFSVTPTTAISSLTQSFHLLLGLPLFLFPTTISITRFPTYVSSLLITCPNHLSLASHSLSLSFSTFSRLLTSSFRILFLLVTPKENLSIFISTRSICFSWLFVTATVSIPYSIVGLIIILYNLPFTPGDTLLSQSTPVTFLQLFHNPHTIPSTVYSVIVQFVSVAHLSGLLSFPLRLL